MRSLEFIISIGHQGLFKTRFEVHNDHLYVSRFCSKLHIAKVGHNGTIGDVTKICNNLAKVDDETFINFCRITNEVVEDVEDAV